MEATGNLQLKWFYGILVTFIIIGSYFLAKEMFWIALIPVIFGVIFLVCHGRTADDHRLLYAAGGKS